MPTEIIPSIFWSSNEINELSNARRASFDQPAENSHRIRRQRCCVASSQVSYRIWLHGRTCASFRFRGFPFVRRRWCVGFLGHDPLLCGWSLGFWSAIFATCCFLGSSTGSVLAFGGLWVLGVPMIGLGIKGFRGWIRDSDVNSMKGERYPSPSVHPIPALSASPKIRLDSKHRLKPHQSPFDICDNCDPFSCHPRCRQCDGFDDVTIN